MTATNRLAKIKTRAEAATEGPWLNVGLLVCSTTTHEDVADTVVDPVNLQQLANADFIAHARTDVPALVAALEAVLEATSKRHGPEVSQQYEMAMESIEDIITEALGCVVH